MGGQGQASSHRSIPVLVGAILAAVLAVAAVVVFVTRSDSHHRSPPVAATTVAVPDVVGQSPTVATRAVTRLGFRVVTLVETPETLVSPGPEDFCLALPATARQACPTPVLTPRPKTAALTRLVVQQDPAAGTRTPPGRQVTVTVGFVYEIPNAGTELSALP